MKKRFIIGIVVCMLIFITGGIYFYNISLPDEDNIYKTLYCLDSVLTCDGGRTLDGRVLNKRFFPKKIQADRLSPFSKTSQSFSIYMTRTDQRVIEKNFEMPDILKNKDFLYSGNNNLNKLDHVTDEQKTIIKVGFKSRIFISDYVNKIYAQVFDKEKYKSFILLGTFYKSSDDPEDYVLNLRGELQNYSTEYGIGSLNRSHYTDIEEKQIININLNFLSNHSEMCNYIQNTGLYEIEPIDFEKRKSYIQQRNDKIEILGFTLYGNKKDIIQLLENNENMYIVQVIDNK